MFELKENVRVLCYTVICFRFILELANHSTYYKYLRLFTYLIMLCLCCNIVFSFLGILENKFYVAQNQYEEWINDWEDYINTERYGE